MSERFDLPTEDNHDHRIKVFMKKKPNGEVVFSCTTTFDSDEATIFFLEEAAKSLRNKKK